MHVEFGMDALDRFGEISASKVVRFERIDYRTASQSVELIRSPDKMSVAGSAFASKEQTARDGARDGSER
jgi:hypothetical protein